jgi:hypothetical protein
MEALKQISLNVRDGELLALPGPSAVIFIVAVRRYLFAMWGIASR